MNLAPLKNKSQIAIVESIHSNAVKIQLRSDIESNQQIEELQSLFHNHLCGGVSQIVFDMIHVEQPGGQLIAMLISQTAKARRWCGDIKVINLSDTARSYFSLFTPLTYLSIGTEEVRDEGVNSGAFSDFASTTVLDFQENVPESLHIPADVDSLNQVLDFIQNLAQKTNLPGREISKLKIAVYEVCINIIEHGYQYRPDESISIQALWKDEQLRIRLTDSGQAFDFDNAKPYNVQEAFEEKRKGGFGLHIIRSSVDDITYRSDPVHGNELVLIMYLNGKVKG